MTLAKSAPLLALLKVLNFCSARRSNFGPEDSLPNVRTGRRSYTRQMGVWGGRNRGVAVSCRGRLWRRRSGRLLDRRAPRMLDWVSVSTIDLRVGEWPRLSNNWDFPR